MQQITMSYIVKMFRQKTEDIIMRKYVMHFILLLSITAVSLPANAYKVKTFKPLSIAPLAAPYSEPGINENYPKITQIEFNLFKKTYEKENIYNRLSRIEKRIFRRNFDSMPLATRVDNILANIDPGVMYNISTRELARLETKVLGRTYPNDDTDSRITRLEKEMLGAMQGGNLSERFDTVKTAAKHYNSFPEIVQSQNVYPQYNNISPYYTPKSSWSGSRVNRGVSGMLQNLLGVIFGNFGSGSLTGFTPPIYDPYNPYINGVGSQDYYMGTHGGHMLNRNLGNHSTVRILD